MSQQAWVVHKFGGSSVADADCFRRVAAIIEADPHPRLAVVLSACKGVTDQLLALTGHAEKAELDRCRSLLDQLKLRHASIAGELLKSGPAAPYLAQMEADCEHIWQSLKTVALVRSAGQPIRDLVAGFGEIWSTRLFAAFLSSRERRPGVRWVDAREHVVIANGSLGPVVQWQACTERTAALAAATDAATLVVTGFIASDVEGLHTTLGRNGSDFSASIFGALLEADEVIIWTDVDGVLSADPRQVPDAKVIDALSYDEAMELAYFGAKVLHPQTMAPAVSRRIPISIRNTFAPFAAGTRICDKPQSTLQVKGIASIEDIALVNLEGAGMIGVPGTAQRLFGALCNANISVILISQGSSEHSICFAIPRQQAQAAEQVVRRAFALELREGQIQSVGVSPSCAIIAVVGDGMAGAHGIAAKVFSALGHAAVNIRAIAQGASERNISAVVDSADVTKALRAVHASFYLSPHTISLGVVGPGTVGAVLLEQLHSQAARLRQTANLDLRVRAIATSRRMLLSEAGIDLANWREALERDGEVLDMTRFTRHVGAEFLPHRVMIDCSASPVVAANYPGWFGAGIHVVTPNKKANSAELADYEAMQAARRQSAAHYFYEATVGAGLPIIQTLRDLRETGDEIQQIEGIFSGTLAYLFNVFDGTMPFSKIVADARARGFTEPDPRDDLSGMDVARKLVILGREMGLRLSLEDVEVESLVPAALRACTAEEFLGRLGEHDAEMAARVRQAKQDHKVLRYVARLSGTGSATVKLEALPAEHSFAHIALTDNVVRFATARYCENPLVVQGPGAGPAVTAGGVFSDLLRLCSFLGARL